MEIPVSPLVSEIFGCVTYEQEAGGRRQEAGCRRREAGGRRLKEGLNDKSLVNRKVNKVPLNSEGLFNITSYKIQISDFYKECVWLHAYSFPPIA
jgi:hypothetical protein